MTAFFLEQPNKTLDGTHATAAPTGQPRLEHGARSVLNLGTRCLPKNKSPFDLLHQKTLTSFIIYAGPPCSIMWHKPWGWNEAWQWNYFQEHFNPEECQIIRFQGKDIGVLSVRKQETEV